MVSSSPGIFACRPSGSTGGTPVRNASAASAVGEMPRRDHSSTADRRGSPCTRSSFERQPLPFMDSSTLLPLRPRRQGFFD